ncbi:MAG: hypothetical protein ACXV8M_00330, partial [Candidatus Angelobacter sp.]
QTNRSYGNQTFLGSTLHFVAGLVSEEVNVVEQTQGLYENRSNTYPLGLAKIVPAAYISETIDMLPPP